MSRFLPACAIACAYLADANAWDDHSVSLLQHSALRVRPAEDNSQQENEDLWTKIVSGPSLLGDKAIVPAPAEAPPSGLPAGNPTAEEMDKGITHIAVTIHDGIIDVMSAPEATQMDADIVGTPRGMALQWVGNHCEFSEVRPDGAAARAGIRVKDRLLAVNGQPIASFDDVFRVVPRSGDFSLTYARSAKMVTGRLSNKTLEKKAAAEEAEAAPAAADAAPVAPTLPEQLEAAAAQQPDAAAQLDSSLSDFLEAQAPPASQLAAVPPQDSELEAPHAEYPQLPIATRDLLRDESQALDGAERGGDDAEDDANYTVIGIGGEPRGFALHWRKGKPVVLSVARDSPAQRAGLATGDIILQINGQAATSLEHATQLVPAEGPFTVTVARSPEEHLSLMSGRNDVQAASTFDADRWQRIDGVFRISVRGPTRGLETSYAENGGAVVRNVQRSSSADISGFQIGDAIERVNGAAVTSAAQLAELFDNQDAAIQVDFTRGVH